MKGDQERGVFNEAEVAAKIQLGIGGAPSSADRVALISPPPLRQFVHGSCPFMPGGAAVEATGAIRIRGTAKHAPR